MSFFTELKRRNVLRVGLAWLGLSWLIVELASLLFPAYGFPTVAIRWLILGLVAMLLPVMVAAWLFDLARLGQRLDQAIIVLILIALSISAVRQFVLPHRVAPPDSPPVAEVVLPAPVIPADPRSVAVLPFANLSAEEENAFLAEGMADELINVLARVDGLTVASRTSSFSFRDRAVGAREIGQTLGVAHILDGSIRRQGNHIRVTAQLVRAEDDRQLWSDTFDRELIDIFTVQEQIAQSIADALSDSLGVRTVTVRRPTDDLEAYELYLRGRQLFAQRGASLEAARELLRQAVARDPRFAEAWAALAGTEFVLPTYSADEDQTAARQRAQQAATTALELIPDHPEALAVSARLSADHGLRAQAMAQVNHALAQDPNNANTWMWKGLTLLEAGHIAAARICFERARTLDPLSGIHHGWLGATELTVGDPAVAEALFQRAHSLGWRGPASAWRLKSILLREGYGAAAALRFNDWLHDDGRIDGDAAASYRAVAHAFEDRDALAEARGVMQAAARDMPAQDWTHPMLFLGLYEDALDEALRPKPPSGQITLMMIWSPVDRAFREHPRFMELAAANGLVEFWQEFGWPDACTLAADGQRLECTR